jgi:hypothetical protein
MQLPAADVLPWLWPFSSIPRMTVSSIANDNGAAISCTVQDEIDAHIFFYESTSIIERCPSWATPSEPDNILVDDDLRRVALADAWKASVIWKLDCSSWSHHLMLHHRNHRIPQQNLLAINCLTMTGVIVLKGGRPFQGANLFRSDCQQGRILWETKLNSSLDLPKALSSGEQT